MPIVVKVFDLNAAPEYQRMEFEFVGAMCSSTFSRDLSRGNKE